MASIWDLHDEIQDKIIEKNIFHYDAMTLKRIDRTVDKVHRLADQHYIDCAETSENIGEPQPDCKCSAKQRLMA